MSDPKYNKYEGTLRFDDDNIVEVGLEPDTENIRVLLNGEEVTGGSGLPEVDSSDNGDVLTVVEGEWTNAAPAGGGSNVMVITITVDETTSPFTVSFDKTAAQVNAHLAADDNNIIRFKYVNGDDSYYYDVKYFYTDSGTSYLNLISLLASVTALTVYPGAVIIDSDSITWDDTLDGNTTGIYPGANYNIDYNAGD